MWLNKDRSIISCAKVLPRLRKPSRLSHARTRLRMKSNEPSNERMKIDEGADNVNRNNIAYNPFVSFTLGPYLQFKKYIYMYKFN